MIKNVYFVTACFSLALVFQVFATVSVPITNKFSISSYNGYRFGVFGWCSESTKLCSPVKVGYSRQDILLLTDHSYISLPSHAKYSISKLLVVHPISFAASFILWIFSILIHFQRIRHNKNFLLMFIIFCTVTFLISVLSFLVDIIIFVSYVTWTSWLVLVSSILIAVTGTILSMMRRSVILEDYSKLDKRDEMIQMIQIRNDIDFDDKTLYNDTHVDITEPPSISRKEV